MKVSSTFNMTVPLNPVLVPDKLNPTELAIELWFKADNIMSLSLEIILGLLPYKLRKKAGTA